MSYSWPIATDFPTHFLVGSVRGGPEDNTIRTQVGQGRERVRRRYSTPVETYNGALLFPSIALFETFENFFKNTLQSGTQEFTWVHPLKPLQSATLRFVGPYDAELVTETTTRVTCSVEIVP